MMDLNELQALLLSPSAITLSGLEKQKRWEETLVEEERKSLKEADRTEGADLKELLLLCWECMVSCSMLGVAVLGFSPVVNQPPCADETNGAFTADIMTEPGF
ncbi:hypothetical protein AOLI_G00068960 [Acnodon oligacanthus]